MTTQARIHTLLRGLLLAACALTCCCGARASLVSIKARLDSAYLLMGRTTTLHLETVQDRNAVGTLPMFSGAGRDGYVALCGDSVELSPNYTADTVDLGSGHIQVNYSVPLQSFDSGYYHLPAIPFVVGRDTAYSNRVVLKVLPVAVEAEDPISDYMDVVNAPKGSFLDDVPDILYYWWWLILIVFALLLWVGWLILRWRRTGTIHRPKPQPSPYETAMAALTDLRKRNLWQEGREKEYYTRLVDIVRVYLEGRFGINAMEMNSSQIVRALRDNREISGQQGYVSRILEMADFVKFAKDRPMPEDNEAAYDNALRFVEETKPLPSEQKDEESSAAGMEQRLKIKADKKRKKK